MKARYALFLTTSSLLHAGADLETPLAAKAEPWIKPVIDIRARYEFGDVDGFDRSHALTLRERLGLKTQAWNGFSALIEGEFSQAAIDDYHGAAPGVDPFNPSNSAIADPETNELNQAYLQYAGFDTVTKIGRQRLIYDNAAFIGNVGWRQNEQTFDAVTIVNSSIDSLLVNYAYLNQINRIFGSDANGSLATNSNVSDIGSNVHLLNASYGGIEGVTLGAYSYLMDFEDRPNWDNNTFGATVKASALGLAFYGELAFQDEAGFNTADEALYAHVSATKVLGNQSLTLGIEHLDAGFKTPLSTVHAFNGFADAFIGGRVEGNHNGLTDLYLSHTMPIIAGIKWTNVLHAFGDNSISAGYGWEYNSILVKKFDDHFTAIGKFAYFESEGDAFAGAAGLPTINRFSVELNYTF